MNFLRLIILLFTFLTIFSRSLKAQCFQDNHSTNTNDSWVSCSKSQNPNPIHGNSHWVMYDLGYSYQLEVLKLWNYNVQNETSQGVQHLTVDYSIDGTNWSQLGNFTVPEAPGNEGYSGFEGINFNGAIARYVVLTLNDNWAGNGCTGFSEVKFNILNNILPVDLTLFNARPIDYAAQINWETKSEVNFSHYELNRSNGNGHFEHTATIDAQNDPHTNYYEYLDLNITPGKTYLYKLKMVDLDGQYIYSDTRKVAFNSEQNVQIFPNPTQDIIRFDFRGFDGQKELITYNPLGMEIQRVSSIENQLILDIQQWPKGKYFCKLLQKGNLSSIGSITKI